MTLLFRMSADRAALFFELCQEHDINTEEQRTQLLIMLSELGLLDSVSQTDRTPDEVAKDLSKHFKTLYIKGETNEPERPEGS